MSDEKRFALFAGLRFYPRGGIKDFRAFGDSQEELETLCDANIEQWLKSDPPYTGDHWGQIADIKTMKVISERDEESPWHSPDDSRYW